MASPAGGEGAPYIYYVDEAIYGQLGRPGKGSVENVPEEDLDGDSKEHGREKKDAQGLLNAE